MGFADGELRLDCEAVGGWCFSKDSYVSTDTLCRFQTPDGRRGFCDFELGNGRTTAAIHESGINVAADGTYGIEQTVHSRNTNEERQLR
jgi:hypothetical protein